MFNIFSHLNQNEQVIVSEESSCHSSPSATSHPDPRDAYRTLKVTQEKKKLERKQKYPPDSQRLRRETDFQVLHRPPNPPSGGEHP